MRCFRYIRANIGSQCAVKSCNCMCARASVHSSSAHNSLQCKQNSADFFSCFYIQRHSLMHPPSTALSFGRSIAHSLTHSLTGSLVHLFTVARPPARSFVCLLFQSLISFRFHIMCSAECVRKKRHVSRKISAKTFFDAQLSKYTYVDVQALEHSSTLS